MHQMTLFELLTLGALPILLAITLHEVAHGWVAKLYGDKTAQMMGRLTTNPLKHIDPVGTVILPLTLFVLGGFLFGWAKPVPVDPRNFKKPREHMAVVAFAGPASNFIMAVVWALLLALAIRVLNHTWIGYPLSRMAQIGVFINLVLMVLNLVPIPPLDGGRVVTGLLSPNVAMKYARIEPYGIWILLLLLVTGVLGQVLFPIITSLQSLLRFY